MRLPAAVCCLLLAACGGPAPLAPLAPPPPQVRRITYWEKWTGFEGEAMQAVVNAFNLRERERAAREPGHVPIEVEMTIVSQLNRKLLVAIAGGTAPDVCGGWTWMVYSYSEMGAFRDLSDRIAADPVIGPDHYLPVFWEMCQYDGATWCLPTTPASTALHWNQRLFREAGLDPAVPPRTIEELDALAEKLTLWEVERPDGRRERVRGWRSALGEHRTATLVQAGFLPTEPGWWSWSWGFHFGGKPVDDADANRITATTPENLRAYAWCASWLDRLGADNIKRFTSNFGNFSSPQNAFLAGKVAMEIQGVWMYHFIEMYNPALEWGAAAFPPPADRPDLAGCNNVEADVIAIPTGSAHPEEAWEFIRYVQSQTGMEALCLGHRKFSPLAEVSPAFQARHPHPFIDLFRTLAISRNGYSTPKLGIWNEYNRELGQAFTDIMGGADPATALATVQARIQAASDRNRRVRQARGWE
jgi:multiple sugar transport system substrate-binding protein